MIKLKESITKAVWHFASAHALAEYPKESCGLVIRVDGIQEYVACRNKAEVPGNDFVMDPEDQAKAEDRGTILAVIHSHPDGSSRLSPGDRVQLELSELPWAVLAVQRELGGAPEVTSVSWNLPTGYEAPLVGRQYSWGILDCYSIVRDYYRMELGVILPDFPRTDGFWLRGENLFVEGFAKAGFKEITLREMQPHDTMLMMIRSKVPNHAGIYLGDGVMLHHPYQKLSVRDPFGGYWFDHCTHILRHESRA